MSPKNLESRCAPVLPLAMAFHFSAGYLLAKKMLANSKNCSIINKHEFLCKISAAGKLPPYRP